MAVVVKPNLLEWYENTLDEEQKEILQNHLANMNDLTCGFSAVDTQEAVDEYCKQTQGVLTSDTFLVEEIPA